MKIYIIILLNIIFLNSIFALDVNELNGTNGIAFYKLNGNNTFGNDITFFPQKENCWVAIGSSSSDIVIKPKFIQLPFFDCGLIDGTNGFKFKENIGGLSGHKPSTWESGTYLAGVSSTLEEYTKLPIVLLSITNDFYSKEVSLTDSVWNCSMRVYLSNAPSYLTHARMIGNFFSSGYGFAAYSYPDKVFAINVNDITNGPRLVNINSSNVVRFTSSGWPGFSLTGCGDTNNDDYDDLLIGSFSNDKCWLIFGGRGWSGEEQFNDIGTNGVILSSLSLSHPVADLGDLNDDGLQDFAYCDGKYIDGEGYYYHVAVVYGKTNWPTHFDSNNSNGKDGFIIDTSLFGYAIEIAGNGDVNGDGHEDFLFIDYIGNVIGIYGGPFIKTNYPIASNYNCTNSFGIGGFGFDYSEKPDWAYADINGDANGDGFDDILLGIGSSSRPTNYAYLVYGGQSPSAPPALRTPLWINVGESNSLIYELDNVPTNITWTGCKKGDDYTLCYTNGARCPSWDIPMGELWFTNSYTISITNDILSVSYTSTNALGPAIGYTTLAIEPVPEPLSTGIVVLTTVLIGKTLATNKTNKSLNH